MKVQVVGLAVLSLSLLGADVATRDRVELVSGYVFYGTILRCQKHEVSIQLRSGGILSFRLSQVFRIRVSERSLPVLKDQPLIPGENELEFFVPRAVKRTRDGRPAAADPPAGPRPDRGEGSGPMRELLVVEAPQPVEIPPLETLRPLEQPPERPAGVPAGERPEERQAAEAPPSDPSAPGAKPAPGEPVIDFEHRFSVVPPQGFARQPEEPDLSVVQSFRDLLTQATFVVTAYKTDAPLIEIKKQVTDSYTSRFEDFHIEQDSAFPGSNYDGWLVDVRSQLGKIAVRQLQLFARSHGEILILTYSTSRGQWESYEKPFLRSIESLRILADSPDPSPDDSGGRASAPGPAAEAEPSGSDRGPGFQD